MLKGASMVKPSRFHLFISFALLAAQGAAHATPESAALHIIQRRLAMTNPSTVFDKWQADQWTFAAIQCGRAAGLTKELSTVERLPLYLNGTNASPKNMASYCEALAASGPAAECFELSATQPPFTMPTTGLPSNYLFLGNASAAKDGSQHMVGGYCNLVKNTPNTRQFFAGNATLTWLAQPRAQSFQTANGPRTLNAGAVSFSVVGMPGMAMPKTVIVQGQ